MVSLTGFLVLSIIVARYLGKEQYGIMNYVVSFVAIFQVFANFGLDYIQIREESKRPEMRDKILGTTFALKLFFACLTILAILLVVLLFESDTRIRCYIMIYAFSVILNTTWVSRNHFTSIVWNEYVVKTEISRTLIGIAIKVAFVLLRLPLVWFICSLLIDSLLLAVGYTTSYVRKIDSVTKWRFDRSLAAYLLRQSFPLLLSSTAFIVYNRIDQMMVGKMIDQSHLGIYSAAIRFVELLVFVPTIIAQTISPMLVEATYPLPPRCPNCESHDLRSLGYGTERIEDEIQRIFPQSRVARMDLDTTRSRQAYEQLLSDFQHGHTDILVGTQMVTKGLDFERVSVVGILNADTMLNQPDFRSHERAFQLLSQVAGRAGRRQHQGLVILQTKSPQHSVVQQVVNNDFPSLYRDQMSERQAFHYPPFTRLFGIVVKHRDALVADRLSLELAALLRQVFGARVLGPDTPAVGRVQSLYIRRLLLKVEVRASMAEARLRLRQIQAHLLSQPPYRSAQVYCDVDPV